MIPFIGQGSGSGMATQGKTSPGMPKNKGEIPEGMGSLIGAQSPFAELMNAPGNSGAATAADAQPAGQGAGFAGNPGTSGNPGNPGTPVSPVTQGTPGSPGEVVTASSTLMKNSALGMGQPFSAALAADVDANVSGMSGRGATPPTDVSTAPAVADVETGASYGEGRPEAGPAFGYQPRVAAGGDQKAGMTQQQAVGTATQADAAAAQPNRMATFDLAGKLREAPAEAFRNADFETGPGVAADSAAARQAIFAAVTENKAVFADLPQTTAADNSAATAVAADAEAAAERSAAIRSQVSSRIDRNAASLIGRGRLSLELNPRELGRVEVIFDRNGQNLQVTLHAETAAAAKALREGAGELGEAIIARGGNWRGAEVIVHCKEGEESDKDAGESGSETNSGNGRDGDPDRRREGDREQGDRS